MANDPIVVSSFNDIPFTSLARDDTLVLFDLDGCVTIESAKVMRDVNCNARTTFLNTIAARGDGELRVAFALAYAGRQLVEPALLEKLAVPGLHAVGVVQVRSMQFPFCFSGIREEALRSKVLELGIKFPSPFADRIAFPDLHPSDPRYKEHAFGSHDDDLPWSKGVTIEKGVVFGNNLSMNLVLSEIFARAGVTFKRICYISSDRAVLERLREEPGLECIKYLYKGAELLDHTVDDLTVAIQRKYMLDDLPVMLSDEEAEARGRG